MNAAESEVAKLLNARLGDVGQVTDLSLGRGSFRLTLDLAGQGAPVTLHAEGLRWNTEGDQLVIRWDRAGSDLRWADTLVRALGERSGHRVSLPDSLRLMPVKLLLPKG
jgi:hypothetical protein